MPNFEVCIRFLSFEARISLKIYIVLMHIHLISIFGIIKCSFSNIRVTISAKFIIESIIASTSRTLESDETETGTHKQYLHAILTVQNNHLIFITFPEEILTNTYSICDGFQEDCQQLLDNFLKRDSIRYKVFVKQWKESKFDTVFW